MKKHNKHKGAVEIPIEDASADETKKDAKKVDKEKEFKAHTVEKNENQASKQDSDDLIAEAEAIAEDALTSEKIELMQKEVQEWKDKYVRLHAEWDTYRRRIKEQRVEEKLRATEDVMNDLIPVLDDFERTVEYAQQNGETGLLEGVIAVQNKLLSSLEKAGLSTINPAGEPYEALEAQAVGTVEDSEAFDETVHTVLQKGYRMGIKVLRPAMVTITTGGPKRPNEEDKE